jgi:hypothetical protein
MLNIRNRCQVCVWETLFKACWCNAEQRVHTGSVITHWKRRRSKVREMRSICWNLHLRVTDCGCALLQTNGRYGITEGKADVKTSSSLCDADLEPNVHCFVIFSHSLPYFFYIALILPSVICPLLSLSFLFILSFSFLLFFASSFLIFPFLFLLIFLLYLFHSLLSE